MGKIKLDNNYDGEKLAPKDDAQTLSRRLAMLDKMFLLYGSVTLLILAVALVRLKFPALDKLLLREEVGLVAFICFTNMQIIFEVVDEDTIAKHPRQYYAKLAVYLLDGCLLINARIQPSLVIFGSLFILLQLLYLYLSFRQEYAEKTRTPRKEEPHSYSTIGTLAAFTNGLAVVLVMGKDIIFHVSPEAIKALVAGGLIMYYFQVMIHAKMEGFLSGTYILRSESVLFYAFRIFRPVASALLYRAKKLKKLKVKL